jgi:hypothetical protein
VHHIINSIQTQENLQLKNIAGGDNIRNQSLHILSLLFCLKKKDSAAQDDQAVFILQ